MDDIATSGVFDSAPRAVQAFYRAVYEETDIENHISPLFDYLAKIEPGTLPMAQNTALLEVFKKAFQRKKEGYLPKKRQNRLAGLYRHWERHTLHIMDALGHTQMT